MLSEQTVDQILALQQRYPQKRGALLMALHTAQEEKGFLAKEDFAELGDLFNLDPAEVESVASFYTMYYTKPQGKCLFQLCTNVSCMVEGAYPVLEHLRNALGIAPGEVTPDGLFGLMEVECLAACDTGPCLQISDREYYQRVTIEQVDRIIAHFRQGGTHPGPGAEPNPLEWTGSVAFEPLAPLTPAEVKPRPGAAAAKPPAPAAPATPSAPAAAPSAPKGPSPAVITAAPDAPPPAAALKAEAEAYARIQAAEEAKRQAVAEAARIEAARTAKRAAEREALRLEAEAADAKKLAEVEARERAKFLEATKLTVVRPPLPEPEPEPEEESAVDAAPVDLSVLEPGKRIGAAAPPLIRLVAGQTLQESTADGDAAVEAAEPAPEPEPEPDPVLVAPPEPQLNLETAPDLPTWQPENPYLRFLQGPEAPTEAPRDEEANNV